MELNQIGSRILSRSTSSSQGEPEMSVTWGESAALTQGSDTGPTTVWQAVVRSSAFRLFFAVLLFINFMLMIIETDKRSLRQSIPSSIIWGMRAILVLFCFEIICKVSLEGKAFLHSYTNILDVVVVVVDIVFEALSYVEGFFPFNMSWLRLLRLLRLMKFLKTFTMLRELSFMLHSFGGAMRAIVWAIVILFFMLTFCSLVAVHVVQPLNEEVAATGVYDGCARCPKAFQTVMDSNLTFMQTIVAGDSWGQVSIPIMEMFPWTAVLFSSMLVSITLGVMNLILSCIVDKAMESRENDKEYQLVLKRSNFESALKEMVGIWKKMDEDGNGQLSREELHNGFDNIEAFAKIVRSLDLRRQDIERLFNMMDQDRSAHVDYEEFVMCLHALEFQNPRTTSMLIQHELHNVKREVERLCNKLTESSDGIQNETASVMEVLDRISHQVSIDKMPASDTLASATVASASSLDNFVIKLEQRFSALLQNLVQEEQLWSSSVRTADANTLKAETEDIVPSERRAIEKQAKSNVGGSRNGSSFHGRKTSLSSSIKDSSINNFPCIRNGSHSDELLLPCHLDTLSTSSVQLRL